MRKLIFPLLFLHSCINRSSIPGGDDQTIVFAAPSTKQKQKIAFLKKKLSFAEKEQQKALNEVERLQSQINEAQLVLIRKQVDSYEQQIEKFLNDPQKYAKLLQIEATTLFLKEREMLHQMIQSGPSPSAFEAQVVLDRILRFITDLGNKTDSFE